MNGPLVIARAVHLAATLLLTGTLTFRCLVAAPVFRDKAGTAFEKGLHIRLAWMIWAALAVAAVSGGAWLVLLAAEAGGVPVEDALSQGLPLAMLTQTTFGDAWMLRLELATVLAVLLLATALAPAVAPRIDVVSTLLAAALAASIAWTGHAAGTEGIDGAVHLASDALHLVAAGAWLGALLPLALLLSAARRAGDPASTTVAYDVTRRFSVLGIISVAAILVTGTINTWEILGVAAFSADGDYDRLLLAKIGLFIVMVAIAAYNRQCLTPRLSRPQGRGHSVQQLQWNSLVETGLGLAILIIVAALGRMTLHSHG